MYAYVRMQRLFVVLYKLTYIWGMKLLSVSISSHLDFFDALEPKSIISAPRPVLYALAMLVP